MPMIDIVIEEGFGLKQINRLDDISVPAIPAHGDIFTWIESSTTGVESDYIVTRRNWRVASRGTSICVVYVVPVHKKEG